MTHHPSFGAILSWDPAGGTAFSAVGQVKDIDVPSYERGDIDVTDHDSTSGFKEFLPGLTDPGELAFVLGWDPHDADHVTGAGTGLIGDFVSTGCTLPAWKVRLVTCNGTADWTFNGYVKTFAGHAPVEGELTADVTVKISGVPALEVT